MTEVTRIPATDKQPATTKTTESWIKFPDKIRVKLPDQIQIRNGVTVSVYDAKSHKSQTNTLKQAPTPFAETLFHAESDADNIRKRMKKEPKVKASTVTIKGKLYNVYTFDLVMQQHNRLLEMRLQDYCDPDTKLVMIKVAEQIALGTSQIVSHDTITYDYPATMDDTLFTLPASTPTAAASTSKAPSAPKKK
jgi:hypothetical protein